MPTYARKNIWHHGRVYYNEFVSKQRSSFGLLNTAIVDLFENFQH